MTKIVQTKIPREVDEFIAELAKSQMVSRAAIVRQLLVKAVAKVKSKSEEVPA